jgi:hypothetical protein
MFVRLAVYLDIRRYLIQNVPVAHKAAGARIADRMIKWHEFVFPMLANFYFKNSKV